MSIEHRKKGQISYSSPPTNPSSSAAFFQAILMRRASVLSFPLLSVFPGSIDKLDIVETKISLSKGERDGSSCYHFLPKKLRVLGPYQHFIFFLDLTNEHNAFAWQAFLAYSDQTLELTERNQK
jgi:hypothetical protein